MATEDQLAAERRRRGYWIRLARKRKGLKLGAVASLLGYADDSGSTVSLWETGKRPVPSDKLGRLAKLLDLPPRFLVKPPRTDEERLEAAIHAASELEREDWAEEEEAGPEAEAALDAWRHIRPA